MIKVIEPGFFTTIQDLGRIGYREFGVPVAGPMDAHAAQLANALLGNDMTDAVMEITMTGPTLHFNSDTAICITGASMNPMLNARPIASNQMTAIHADDVLSFGTLEIGVRAYIAVSGGFLTEKVMGSRSMYPNITSKNRIETNAVLKVHSIVNPITRTYASIKSHQGIFNTHVLNVVEGPEFDSLPESLQNKVMSNLFTVSKNNNRMGYQLEERLKNSLKNLLTGPVLPGTVQLTSSGKLIVLMRDGQTTGGYPRVLQLKEASINVLSQKRLGDAIRFQF